MLVNAHAEDLRQGLNIHASLSAVSFLGELLTPNNKIFALSQTSDPRVSTNNHPPAPTLPLHHERRQARKSYTSDSPKQKQDGAGMSGPLMAGGKQALYSVARDEPSWPTGTASGREPLASLAHESDPAGWVCNL